MEPSVMETMLYLKNLAVEVNIGFIQTTYYRLKFEDC